MRKTNGYSIDKLYIDELEAWVHMGKVIPPKLKLNDNVYSMSKVRISNDINDINTVEYVPDSKEALYQPVKLTLVASITIEFKFSTDIQRHINDLGAEAIWET